MCNRITRYISLFLLSAIVISCMQFDTLTAAAEETDVASVAENAESYALYLENNRLVPPAPVSISLNLDGFIPSDNAEVEKRDNCLIWNNGTGNIELAVNIPETAMYNLKLLWRPVTTGTDISLGIKIDGAYPYPELEALVLNREWKNASEKPRTDDQGNEYAPEQIEVDTAISTLLHDHSGAVTDPYEIALTAGTHTVTLTESKQSVIIEAIELCPPEQTGTYSEISADYEIKELDTEIITIQGEDADVKSTNSIIPKSNNSNAGMTPSDIYKAKINYIGGTSWQSPGERLTWEFNVSKSGYYYLSLRYKQSDLVNGESLRWLKVDGKTPFVEAKSIAFPYSTDWIYYSPSDSEENPYYIWLEEGKHNLSMEVTLGEQSEFFKNLSEIVKMLGDEYIKIITITGETPDINRDYELFNQIPDFTETLTDIKNNLDALALDMEDASGGNATQIIAAMKNMSRVLNNMLKSPYIAQQYVTDYYTNYTSVSAWLYDMKKMPLSVDEIQIVPAGSEYENKNAGFFRAFSYWLLKLISSFSSEYSVTALGGETDENTIRLWINWGQDQATVLNSLIKDSFTPQTGINVQFEIVNASLINGILSGNAPDMVLNLSRTDPVNLGIRGALADLTQFEGCEQVLERFQENAELPYRYNGALYALPDTQSYFLMFYRKDILNDLQLLPPETWEEFIHAATIIQRNNMSVYVPYTQIVSSTTVNAGIGNMNMFPTLMLQNGLSLYNEELNASDIVSKKAIAVFEQWTKFYTDYAFYKEADFYNRFRVGAMPLGISTHTTYLTLYSAAPEIKDRWAVALVPGTVGEDGSINRTVAGGGTGCAIVEQSTKKAQAWEFLKWWTSENTQMRYSNNVESILGTISRVSTSNINAFQSLSWEKDDLDVFMQQWKLVSEIPEVPGGYYLTRAVDQAYWAVINGTSATKDAVLKWSRDADDEIDRKIKEYT